MNDAWKLLGVAIVVAGLALRLRATLVVVASALTTGLLAGLPLVSRGGQEGLLEMLGRAFTDNRLMTLFLATLPAIGLFERYGLQERSAALIRRFRAATAGRLAIAYQLFRVLHGLLGIRLNGHPLFVKPLIYPMARGADGAASPETLKAATSAAENYGNFYGQNLSPVQPGILLVYGVMKSLGYEVSAWRLVLWAAPLTALSVIFGAAQFLLLDRRLKGSACSKPSTH